MDGCVFDTCYYGLMNGSEKSHLCVQNNIFEDVPKGLLLLRKTCQKTVEGDIYEFEHNTFKYSERFLLTDIDFTDDNDVEIVRQNMYIYFSTNENLPHRIAYENGKYCTISSNGDITRLLGKCRTRTTHSIIGNAEAINRTERKNNDYKNMV